MNASAATRTAIKVSQQMQQLVELLSAELLPCAEMVPRTVGIITRFIDAALAANLTRGKASYAASLVAPPSHLVQTKSLSLVALTTGASTQRVFSDAKSTSRSQGRASACAVSMVLRSIEASRSRAPLVDPVSTERTALVTAASIAQRGGLVVPMHQAAPTVLQGATSQTLGRQRRAKDARLGSIKPILALHCVSNAAEVSQPHRRQAPSLSLTAYVPRGLLSSRHRVCVWLAPAASSTHERGRSSAATAPTIQLPAPPPRPASAVEDGLAQSPVDQIAAP